MSNSIKTTVYLTATDYRRLQALARSEKRPSAELVREAVAIYVSSRAPAALPSSIGAGRSGRADISERTDELMKGFGER